MTLPCGSVIETIVLLNVLLMCAAPCGTFFFSRRRVFCPFLGAEPVAFFAGGIGYLAFFLPAMVRFGPLRVRALVLVRWPRTGMPRRCPRPWEQPISILRRGSGLPSRGRSPSPLQVPLRESRRAVARV